LLYIVALIKKALQIFALKYSRHRAIIHVFPFSNIEKFFFNNHCTHNQFEPFNLILFDFLSISVSLRGINGWSLTGIPMYFIYIYIYYIYIYIYAL